MPKGILHIVLSGRAYLRDLAPVSKYIYPVPVRIFYYELAPTEAILRVNCVLQYAVYATIVNLEAWSK